MSDKISKVYKYAKDTHERIKDWHGERKLRKRIDDQNAVGSQVIILSLIFILYLADLFYGLAFNRGPGQMFLWLFVYALAGILAYFAYQGDGDVDKKALMRQCMTLSLLTWGVPVAIMYLKMWLIDGTAWIYLGSLTNYLGTWAIILLTYALGWPREIMTALAEGDGALAKFGSFLNFIVIFALMVGLLFAIFGGLQRAGILEETGVSNYDYQQVSVSQMVGDAGGFFVRVGKVSWGAVTGKVNDTTSVFNNQVAEATETSYKGTVESQQGKPLGVYIRGEEPIKPYFAFEQRDGESVIGQDKEVVWFGEVQARTFVDSLTADLNCKFISTGTENPPAQGEARPTELRIFYTGDFTDSFPFECSVPMEEIYAATDNGQRLAGRFVTEADFTFQTWGYATLTFMDRSIITAYRRDGRDPARELGIEPMVNAKYTPGPVSLGMLDRQRLPIGIDTQDPESTFIPAFGVTLRNQWAGRGEVRGINKLVLQVPEPLMLEVDECVGLLDEEGKPVDYQIRNPGSSIVLFSTADTDSEVPQGYTWYEFEGLTFDEDEQRLRTVRCPMSVKNDRYGELLGPDLSVREFTLVALADYDYRSENPVNIGLRLEKLTQ